MKKNLIKKNILVLFLSRWFSVVFFLFLAILLFCFEIFVPANPSSHETITYTAQKGLGDEDIARDLEKLGIIRSNYFFRLYVVFSFQHSKLQAGKYNLSSRLSVYQIVRKFAVGDVIKNKITILEGWDTKDIAEYFQARGICDKDDFIKLTNQDYSQEFDFLKDKPKGAGLEGYLFPDTYQVSDSESAEDILGIILTNFGKKFTPEIKAEIASQSKSIFEIITMASIIEKEVRTIDDKKIVSGIFWKRIEAGIPLQSCATINYITGKNDPGAAIIDTEIDSPYNTYKYKGLPKGPISNPGIDSIIAALNPTKTAYLYYLSRVDGKTIFSKTLKEHNKAKAKYLRYLR